MIEMQIEWFTMLVFSVFVLGLLSGSYISSKVCKSYVSRLDALLSVPEKPQDKKAKPRPTFTLNKRPDVMAVYRASQPEYRRAMDDVAHHRRG